ncbi:MAG: hypothetical protein IPG51_07915 [Chloroflexi bacterium]|nr:hypothetical protein [Chloroflexota bacterium]
MNYHMPVLYFTQLMGLAFGHEPESIGHWQGICQREGRIGQDRGGCAGRNGR